MIIRTISLLAAIAASIAPALADDITPSKLQLSESTLKDIKCLYVAIAEMESAEPMQKEAGMMANFYWLGKIAAVDPSLTGVEEILITDTMQIQGASFKREAVRCGTEMKTMGKRENELGSNMVARGKRLEQTQ